MIRISVCLCSALFLFNSPTLFADDADKLDAILRELKTLNARVTALEEEVGRLRATTRLLSRAPGAASGEESGIRSQRARIPVRRLPSPSAEEVIRMQNESPGELQKGIHERERLLRKRPFPADVVPLPPRIIQKQ